MIKLNSIEKSKAKNKKYVANFEIDGKKKKVNFGDDRYLDYTLHKDNNRKKKYISRHKVYLKNDLTKPSYLSMAILWNKTSLEKSIADYRRLLNQYNKEKDIEKIKNYLIN